MAITTLDGIIAGMQAPQDVLKVGAATTAGRFYSPLYVGGQPGASVAPTPGVGGAALTTYAGQIPWTNPSAGNSYLAGFSGGCNAAGVLLLCDRLWHNSGLSATLTTSQTVTSAAFPARDRAGSVNGAGVFVGLEVSTVMGAGVPTITMGYTNSGLTAGRSIVTPAMTATMAVGSFIPLGLQAGDVGVKSIETFQLSATMTSGAFHLVAYRVLARAAINVAGGGFDLDAVSAKFPRLYDNTVPFLLFLPNSTTAPTISAMVNISQG